MDKIFEKGDIAYDENLRKVEVLKHLPDVGGYLAYPMYNKMVTDEFGEELYDDDGDIAFEQYTARLPCYYQKLTTFTAYAEAAQKETFRRIQDNYLTTTFNQLKERKEEMEKEISAYTDLRKRLQGMKHKTRLINTLLDYIDGVPLWVGDVGPYKPFISLLSETEADSICGHGRSRLLYISENSPNDNSQKREGNFDWILSKYTDSSGGGREVRVASSKCEVVEMLTQDFIEVVKEERSNYKGLFEAYSMLVGEGANIPEHVHEEMDKRKESSKQYEKERKQTEIENLRERLKELETERNNNG